MVDVSDCYIVDNSLCVVYNWTVDEVIDWLCNVVVLPQYSNSFRQNGIRGKDMPRYITYTLKSLLL